MKNKLYRRALWNTLIFGGAMLLITLLCSCCSPAQRLSRLVERHPELVRQTTVEVPVMHVTPERIIVDTILLLKYDTVRFETSIAEGYVVPSSDTSIRINVVVKKDTIRDTVKVEVPQITAIVNEDGFPYWIIPVSLTLLLIMIIIIKIK